MSAKTSSFSLIAILMLLILSTSACGGRRIIKGQVVDVVTARPIENAAIHIEWLRSGSGPPGLASSVTVEVAEDLTNAEGIGPWTGNKNEGNDNNCSDRRSSNDTRHFEARLFLREQGHSPWIRSHR